MKKVELYIHTLIIILSLLLCLIFSGCDQKHTHEYDNGICKCGEKLEEKYTVIFKDYNGTILKKEEVLKNTSATPPEVPLREGYEFIGWNEEYVNIETNIEILAEYRKIEEHIHEFINGECSCGEKEVLLFTLNEDKNSYTVSTIYNEDICNTIEEIVIPSTYENLPVTNIKGYAFDDCDNLKYIAIPNSVVSIGNCAFIGNYNLVSVKFEENSRLEYIGESAFRNCHSLIDISIPESVTSIGSSAFYSSDIRKIEIPSGVICIEPYTFSGCRNLSEIKFHSNSRLTTIGAEAFSWCYSLENITIPDSVTSIEDLAFSGCVNLKNIMLPNSLVSIKSNAFSLCENLEYNIYDNAKYLGNEENPYLLLKVINTEIISCEINEKTKFIYDKAFSGCINLENITLPNSLVSIEGEELLLCENLEYNIYDNAKYLGNKENPYLVLVESINDEITSCEINENTKHIYYGAFSQCINLNNIEIPDGVISIGDHAFSGCINLKKIEIPGSVTSIGYCAFSGCKSLTKITLPFVGKRENTNFDESMFGYIFGFNQNGSNYNCYVPDSLKEVIITKATKISGGAFANCENLQSVILPKNVQYIEYSAFGGCTSLKNIELPNSIISIEEYAFYNCTNLIIYCEAESQPTGWSPYWNPSNCPVVWEYKTK